VFAIQVRIIGPTSVNITEGMLLAKEKMEDCKFQLPTSMVKINKSTTKPFHTPVVLAKSYVDSNPRYPREGV